MSVLTDLRARRDEARATIAAAQTRMPQLQASEARAVRKVIVALDESLAPIEARIAELESNELAESLAAETRVKYGVNVTESHYGMSARTRSRDVYDKERRDVSFFKDLAAVKGGDWDAAQRLHTNNQAVNESRAGDLVSVTATQGGTFAPPLWLVQDWIHLARPHRVTADLLNKQVLPRGVSSINLPAVSTGAATGVQATQNSALTDTAMTTTSVSSGITLIAGKQIVSRQLIDQSGIPFDQVILTDLAADYAKQLDIQVLNGSNASGQLQGLDGIAGNTITYTTASPKVVDGTTAANSFYQQLVSSVNKVATNRYLAPTAIVMHPRRWAWVLNAIDTQNRPLVVPSAVPFNAVASADPYPVAEGRAGELLGIPVYLDANISVTANSSTNQDEVFVLRANDSWLFESDLETASFEATYADNASLLYRVLGYSSLTHRYSKAISKIVGTGLVDPGL